MKSLYNLQHTYPSAIAKYNNIVCLSNGLLSINSLSQNKTEWTVCQTKLPDKLNQLYDKV